jgi:hypothetical protein
MMTIPTPMGKRSNTTNTTTTNNNTTGLSAGAETDDRYRRRNTVNVSLPKERRQRLLEVGFLQASEEDNVNVSLTKERRQRLREVEFLQASEEVRRANQRRGGTGKRNSWEENFELLRQYKEEYGNCKHTKVASHVCSSIHRAFILKFSHIDDLFTAGKVPCSRALVKEEKYKTLGSWCTTMRRNLAKYATDPTSCPRTLTADRRKRLSDLGIEKGIQRKSSTLIREGREDRFNETFRKKVKELQAFKAQHGKFPAT